MFAADLRISSINNKTTGIMEKTEIIKGINQKVINHVGISGAIYLDEPLKSGDNQFIEGIAYDNVIVDVMGENEIISLDSLDSGTLCDVEYCLDCQVESDEKLYGRCMNEY